MKFILSKSILIIIFILFAFVVLEARGQGTTGPFWTPPGPGRFEATVEAQGWKWRLRVHVPDVYDGRKPLPMVLVLHGSGGSGAEFLDKAGWAREAEQSGFLVMAPDALPERPRLDSNPLLNPRRWNSGQLKQGPRTRIDDATALVEMIDLIGRFWRIDRDRIFAVGHSNGGSMAFRLAVEHSERFAAIASVAGIPWQPELAPARPLPTFFLMGTADPILPLQGGKSVLPWEVRETPPIRRVLARWSIAIDGPIEPTEIIEADDGRLVHRYGPGPEGVELLAIFLNGHGHVWPGASGMTHERLMGPITAQVQATPLIWQFFEEHARPAP
ncbi:PHB depolymerase family esterase [soil metagenome]